MDSRITWKTSFLIIMFATTTVIAVSSQSSLEKCCQLVERFSSCGKSCQEVGRSNNWNNNNGYDGIVHYLRNTCASSPAEFWACVQSSTSGSPAPSPLSSLSSSSSSSSSSFPSSSLPPSTDWWGKSCCELSLTSYCKNACLKAKSDHEIESHCSRADGSAVYKCLSKHREGQRCCRSSTTDQCHSSCKALFIQDTPPDLPQIQSALKQCTPPVVQCILARFPTTRPDFPQRNIECCDHGTDDSCSQKCKKVLMSNTSEEHMVEQLTQTCGSPNPGDPMWQCFLMKSAKERGSGMGGGELIGGMDAVKLQCCQRARRNKCKDLCRETFGRGWSDGISDFHEHCTNNVQEAPLNTCLEEAEDRCKLGCSNLTYCSNFNYRPTEMFRKCGPGPDQEARKTFRSWKEGSISLPSIFNFDIPVKDVTRCQPEKWQVIACSLHIKPCRSGGTSWICKRDCLDILNSCMDRKRMSVAVSPREICDLLSPTDDPDQCISIGSYLTEGHHRGSQGVVTTPCNPNPCAAKEVCIVSRKPCPVERPRDVGFNSRQGTKNKFHLSRGDHVIEAIGDFRGGEDCPSYVCKPGCPMGEMVSQLVAPGSPVRLHDPTNQACLKLCRCGHYGNWDNCAKICNEDGRHQRHCLLPSGMIQDHGSIFTIGCNTCICSDRETVCTHKFCRRISFQPSPPYVTYVVPPTLLVAGLPCNCSNYYKPVCASNGQTFPNFCLARCQKFEPHQLQIGSCQVIDPCTKNPCADDERCIKNPQICFGSSHLEPNACLQYKCVKLSSCDPKASTSSSYCDVTLTRDYDSLCEAAVNNSTNLCSRHCSVNCRHHGKVCGVDGVTYASECAARCNNVPVDYYTPCSSVAVHHDVASKVICSRVVCPKKTFVPGCVPTVPSGSCCPICAAEIRCLVSHRQALAMSHHLGDVTVHGLVTTLETLLSVRECTVQAYLSVEAELIILVAPGSQYPPHVQVEACSREASHLSGLISGRSPIIQSNAYTSILLTAELRNSRKTFMYQSSVAAPSVVVARITSLGHVIGSILLSLSSGYFVGRISSCAWISDVVGF